MRIFFLLLYSLLYANEYEIELYKKIFNTLFNKNVKVYSDKNIALNLVKDCKQADVLLIYNLKNLPKCDKPLFVTNYKNFLNTDAIGAFYWRKGRPQLIFRLKTIQKYHLHLSKKLRKYAK